MRRSSVFAVVTTAAALINLICVTEVFAACGAAFCSLTTTPESAHERLGNIRFDLSYEYIDQDTPYGGSRHGDGVQRARLPDGDVEAVHKELNSVGQRVGLRTTAGIAERLTLDVYVPVVMRTHDHLAFEGEEPEYGKFSFSGIGDVTVSGHYSILSPTNPYKPTVVLGAGFKAPTGSTAKTGTVVDAGDQVRAVAERAIQPGSGSWDAILSAYYLQHFGQFATFVNGTVRLPTRDAGYEFGTESMVNLGASYPVLPGLEAILQLNARITGRDRSQEEAELFHQNTGGEYLFVTPGLRAQVSRDLLLYGFVQMPVYRHVNGNQLTADWSISFGINYALAWSR